MGNLFKKNMKEKDLRDDVNEKDDSTAENSGGTGGSKNLPMETKNYIPYIIAGIGLVIAMLIILL